MNYILTMSLSGSCLFILYQGVRLCMKGMLPEGWYYGILKAVMLYFLLPLPWLKKGYLWLAEHLGHPAGVKAVINYSRQDWVLLQGENGCSVPTLMNEEYGIILDKRKIMMYNKTTI